MITEKKRESTLERLKRLKAQEGRPTIRLDVDSPPPEDRYFGSYSYERKEKEQVNTIVQKEEQRQMNLPEQKILNLLKELDSIEKKMHGESGSYLSLYYELQEKEKKFLKEAESMEIQGFKIGDDLKRKIEQKKTQVYEKQKLQQKKDNTSFY